MVKAVRKGMRGECPVAGAGAPGFGAPRTLFLTAIIDILRFEVHLSCSVWVPRRDSNSAHVWYRLRINLSWSWKKVYYEEHILKIHQMWLFGKHTCILPIFITIDADSQPIYVLVCFLREGLRNTFFKIHIFPT